MKLHLLAAFSVMLIGCAGTGPKIDASRLTEIRKGETTIDDVVARFGRPSILSKNMGGTQTAAYMHVEGRSDAAAFVSLVAALAGNTQANLDSVIFYFDVKGVLSDYKTTQANVKTPALANAEKTTETNTNKPPQTDKKSPPRDSNPWSIQLYPSGYIENRP